MNEAIVKTDGAVTFRQATDVAGMCKEIVTSTAIEIQHRKYVKVEGWQAIAVAHGCVASARDVERIQGGVRAIGEVRRGKDGMALATAEGFVGDDETMWGNRPEYAKRAMAQTRAISRACRSAFAHVVVMMNAGLETTPAEEVPEGGFEKPTQEKVVTKPQPKAEPAKPRTEATDDSQTIETVLGEVLTKSGENRNGPWTRYYSKCADGEYYSTFDHTIGMDMTNLSGQEVVLGFTIEQTARGEIRTVRKIRAVEETAEEIGERQQAAQKEPDGSEPVVQDDLPF